MTIRTGLVSLLFASVALAVPAAAVDGQAAPPSPPPDDGARSVELGESYYEEAFGQRGRLEEDAGVAAAAAAGLPTALHIVDAEGGVRYRSLGEGRYKVRIEVARRPHEQVDALYDLVLALALPEGFDTDAWRIPLHAGTPAASEPLVYAGERLRLKRNLPLETTWLPALAGASDGLPDLSGTGWSWTLWDTIVRYDPSAGAMVGGFGTLAFEADAATPALDPEDPANAAYLITWVPALDAAVPPYTIRLDVGSPDEE
ncbi:MAG TPA: hypothetical protein VNE71_10350 [Myxococcota bacterium]|nr:hypothetical protein [Myxococcota bacterium]